MKKQKRQAFTAIFAVGLGLVAMTTPARACLNDRDSDSLAHEAKTLPDVVRVVTGRFERNPPLFYQMRLKRVAREIPTHPGSLLLYDDAAVACDRLGRDTEAIAWIEKKRIKLGKSPWKIATPEIRDAWYRYYANVGTFRVHRWIRAGADPSHLAEVTRARDEIARAIEIKPNAHFNRERYQLAAMNWILHPQQKNEDNHNQVYTASFSEYLANHSDALPNDTAAQVEGLSGLIVLGNAWESVDISEALAQILSHDNRLNLAYLAYLRAEELRKEGRRSLVPSAESFEVSAILDGNDEAELLSPNEVKAKYIGLRREADHWQKERTTFLMTRLRAGRHPDTDAHFWDGYRASTVPPALANPSDALNAQKRREWQQTKQRNAIVIRWINWIAASALLVLFGFPAALIVFAVKARRPKLIYRRTSRPE